MCSYENGISLVKSIIVLSWLMTVLASKFRSVTVLPPQQPFNLWVYSSSCTWAIDLWRLSIMCYHISLSEYLRFTSKLGKSKQVFVWTQWNGEKKKRTECLFNALKEIFNLQRLINDIVFRAFFFSSTSNNQFSTLFARLTLKSNPLNSFRRCAWTERWTFLAQIFRHVKLSIGHKLNWKKIQPL